MNIVRIDPFNMLNRSFFRPILDEDWANLPEMRMTEGLDVFETDTEIIVKAAVPGIEPEKVRVNFEDGVLHISAKEQEKEEEKKKKKTVYRRERVTSFDYVCTLPRPINSEKLSAEVENGILVVKAPIAATSKSKAIPVRTKVKK
jgi:HSP20 family protein